jgi:cytochrome c biogenesis protein CcmG, thiol:disulfide interchange protein DsbE
MPDIEVLKPPDREPTALPTGDAAPHFPPWPDDPSQPRGGRRNIVRNVITAAILGVAIAGAMWVFTRGGESGASQAVTLAASSSGPAPRVGNEAPDFRVRLLDGTVAKLSDFRGRPVWLSFWATWCPPCRSESVEIEGAYEEHLDQGMVVLAIDLGESPGTIKSYVEKAGLSYAIGVDETTQVAALYHVAGLPNHFFIDADGVLREWRVGQLGQGAIDEGIASILPTGAAKEAAIPPSRR